jgi:hypothetical protein
MFCERQTKNTSYARRTLYNMDIIIANSSICELPSPSYDILIGADSASIATTYKLPLLETPTKSYLLQKVGNLLLLVLIFIVCKAFYRRFLHPLARFPGPTFAATTKLFEAYHTLVKNDWFETLQNLHQQYGMLPKVHRLNFCTDPYTRTYCAHRPKRTPLHGP